MKNALAELRRLAVVLAVTYLLLFAAWTGGEAQDPGQQYPDPWAPVALLAVLFGPFVYLFTRRWRRWRSR